ncbi:undecaprenyl-diphosphatase UppP [Orenia marismortui]|uniref:Undecaprenyl-diphosphatase n=1 Tax=Orenia marismortui TaxID=46469 RepID=A0A4R8GIC3_9FIRM|nr:undecaprenyl-diphosphatase UppP [Orenia marismortui]TDX45420.1 undecaprenyl-diphosphatase [Orenia marismortui]
MDLIKVIILGIVQGITEFLPVSSSGHLVIFQHFLNVNEGLTLDVFLHFGTLLAVVVVYWDDILGMITLKEEYRKLTYYVILGSIPAGIIGILFEDIFEQLFNTVKVVGFTLLVTGLLLWLSDRITNEKRYLKDMKLSDSMVVGFAQAFAIIPGISRSGSTIVAGLFKGLDRKLAAKYSFLLSIPVIGGATLLQVKDLMTVGLGNNTITQLVLGTVASAIAGYFSIKLLLKLVNKEKLSVFAYYCWFLGLIIILFL